MLKWQKDYKGGGTGMAPHHPFIPCATLHADRTPRWTTLSARAAR